VCYWVDDATSGRERVHRTPAQVALAWAVQRGTAFLTTSTRPDYVQNFEISALPEDAMREIREGITANVRSDPVVETGVPVFIPSSPLPVRSSSDELYSPFIGLIQTAVA
jgi:hypothetical protein